jgi:hypothetical protein
VVAMDRPRAGGFDRTRRRVRNGEWTGRYYITPVAVRGEVDTPDGAPDEGVRLSTG